MVPLQPSGTVPQLLLPLLPGQACALVLGTHTGATQEPATQLSPRLLLQVRPPLLPLQV